ncbi:hypothetical protein ACAW74_10500 [Fibrella sp. WM1]|uniref:hypothetical protein n=1 Tax=Fibrella musci TaxID=3242485 RepID=UPI00351FD2C1
MTIPPIDYTAPLFWIIGLLLLALLALPICLVSRQQGASPTRRATRLALHGLLWLVLLGMAVQPRWRTQLPAGRVLVVADNVPGAAADRVRDSLHLREVIRARSFRGATDTVVLLGQTFPDALLARLARQVVNWIPYDAPNQLQALTWQGVVRRGELQTVSGQLQTADGGMLRLRYGQQQLDSTRLVGSNGTFLLRYPVFTQGQTSLTLWLDDTLLDTLRFVARPLDRLRVRFVLDAPDFETRTLANWLGQQGHRVELTNTLSKGIGSALTINAPTTGANTLPDLVITDPANVGNALVSKAVAAGKNVLVLNLSRPETDVAAINRALSTRWQVRRIPGKDSLQVGPSLVALPYRFVPAPGTLPVGNYPVMVQPAAGQSGASRVAVSLLTETFPLRLSGDSATYDRLWLGLLAPLQPTSVNNMGVGAPLIQQQPTYLTLNNPTNVPSTLRVGADTLALRPAPINARSWAGLVRPMQAGWQSIQDTLSGYVYAPTQAGALAQLAQRKKIAAMTASHRRYDTHRPSTARFVETPIPDWVWFMAVLLLLASLWVEPKLG